MNTAPIYASCQYDAEDQASATSSFAVALDNLRLAAQKEKREVIWDTLEVDLERNFVTERTYSGESTTTATWHTINVNALGLSCE